LECVGHLAQEITPPEELKIVFLGLLYEIYVATAIAILKYVFSVG
jgi:hypothetical protein